MTSWRPAVTATRLSHGLKNAPILAGLVFGGRIADAGAVGSVALTFLAFWLAASAGYLVNDVVDRDVDRAHPVRRLRPVAAGTLGTRPALALAAVLALASLVLSAALRPEARHCLYAYGALTLAYTFALRRVPGLGPVSIAFGFSLRAAAGAYAADVPPSAWLLSLTGILALALGVSKRESEMRRPDRPPPVALARTTDALLLAAALGYVAYGFAPDTIAIHRTRWLPLTAVPVVAALWRYRSRLRGPGARLAPLERVASDPVLVGLGIVWAALSFAILTAARR